VTKIMDSIPSQPGAGPEPKTPWFAREWNVVVAAFGSDPHSGLTGAAAAERLSHVGPNEIAREKSPSLWKWR